MKFNTCANYSDYAIQAGNGKEITVLYHTTHLSAAASILKDGGIHPKPLKDDSRFSDLSGIWLSPNNWLDGSYYGNVRYGVKLADLIPARQVYWLGTTEWSNGYPICNFFISKSQLEQNGFCPYDLEKDNGPIRLTGEKFSINSSVIVHAVNIDPIALDEVCEISFVDHKPNGKNCCIPVAKEAANRLLIARYLSHGQRSPIIDTMLSINDFTHHLYAIVSHGSSYDINGLSSNCSKSLALIGKIIEQYSKSETDPNLTKCKELSCGFSSALAARSAAEFYIKQYIGQQFILSNCEEDHGFDGGSCFL